MTDQHKIKKENIILDLKANSKEEVIRNMADILFKNGYISNLTSFISDVFDRESHMTTGIGNNLAIPHGKSDAVNESTVAVAKLANPIEWHSLDNKPVDFVFLLAIKSQDKGDEHLRILADLSGKLMDDTFVNQIKSATDVTRLYNALSF